MLPLSVRRLLTGVLSIGLCAVSHPPRALAAAFGQQGANITSRYATDFASSGFQQSLRNLRATGANSVSLIIPYYQSNDYSTDIQPGWNTPSDQVLISGIQSAEADGLQVMLTLHDDPYSGDWRANIDPGDRNGWFASYGAYANHYAQLAQANGVKTLCIGAELYRMTSTQTHSDNTQRWQSLISGVRSRFTGTLTYSANWGAPYDEKDQIGFWGSLDEIGISAYFSLATGTDNPSVSQLTSSWNDWNSREITPLSSTFGKPVLFTEVGYESANGSHYAPGVYGRGGVNLNEQANDYQALFSYWSGKSFFNGTYVWDWSSDPNAGGSGDSSYTPQHKPAEQTMAQAYGGQQPAPVQNVPTGNQSLQLWWPVNGAQVGGVQPFKVTIGGLDPSSYSMYWQVDGGRLNLMNGVTGANPHKEADVDLSGWSWQPSGNYQLNFIAKDANGNVLGSLGSTIRISH